MSLFFDKNSIQSIDDAIGKYKSNEFESPARSTVPLLSWLKHERDMVDKMLENFGMPTESTLHLEYTVAPPRGNGKSSHTDLMIKSGDSTLAIEAKWTESRYKTVDDWLKKGTNRQNRDNVLAGWLGLLQKHVISTLNVEVFSDIVYQMLHRAASVCAAGRNPKLAYLLFKPSPDPKTADIRTIRDDLMNLWKLLGNPSSFPFYMIIVQLSPTDAFHSISSLPKGDEATHEAVRDALYNERLFDFSENEIYTINGDCTW